MKISRCLAALFLLPIAARAQFTDPTPAELSMKSVPQVPGAAAVYLFREEITEDDYNMFSTYVRLKILTEKGIDEANVEIPFVNSEDGSQIDSIQGRTIHSDGTIIPLTAKPYDKLVQKVGDRKYMAKVFTLPSVEVGSILEYRFKRHLDDHWFATPRWYIQSDYYTMKAHYFWHPTDKPLILSGEHGSVSSSIHWLPILPKNADLKHETKPSSTKSGQIRDQLTFDLNVSDIPPQPHEEYMPPIDAFSYRVVFYYSSADTPQEYWKNQGKYWAKEQEKFIGPGKEVKSFVEQTVAASDTPDQRLQKLYSAVMQLENTDFTRQHLTSEERAAGLKDIKTTDDVLIRKRGSSDQLADLFLAMARAAGFKAWPIVVTNRDRSIFVSTMLSPDQLDDVLAIVEVDGKERFFDPGSRFCEYGHLAWKHTLATGIREVEKGTAIGNTPGELYTASSVKRVADLSIDEAGVAKGFVTLTMTGDEALEWRHRALRGDETELSKDLKNSLETVLPAGVDVKVDTIDAIDDPAKPLTVKYLVEGPIGNSTGKRLLIPSDIFVAAAKPTFSLATRTTPVYFHYPYTSQDAVRYKFPETFTIESAPAKTSDVYKASVAYSYRTESTTTSVTSRRNFTLGQVILDSNEFADLRAFYSKFEAKDQEPIVLAHKPSDTAVNGSPAPINVPQPSSSAK